VRLVRQRVYQIACGYEDQNDAQTLRTDLLLKLMLGRLPETWTDLAIQPSLSRLENTPGAKDCLRMAEALGELYIRERSKVGASPERIHLDFDATDDPAHGSQEGAHYHGYYKVCNRVHTPETPDASLVMRVGQRFSSPLVGSLQMPRAVSALRVICDPASTASTSRRPRRSPAIVLQRRRVRYARYSTSRSPTPSIWPTSRSPLRTGPTPLGVPVMIRSPGRSSTRVLR
jgi:Transposase DDE domain group 1